MFSPFLLWIILTLFLYAVWQVPEVLGKRVYPQVRLDVEVEQDVVDVGEAVIVRCRLSNPTRFPCARIKLNFLLPQELGGAGSDDDRIGLETYLSSRQNAELVFTVHAMERGLARLNDVTLEFTDVFGLRKSERTVFTGAKVIVRPERGQPLPVANAFHELLGEIRTRRFYQEDPSLFTGIRPYQPGDAWRNVSWLATARSGELLVKQFGYTTASRVLILLNGQMHNQYWRLAPKGQTDILCQRLVQIASSLCGEGAAVGLLTNLKDSYTMSLYEAPASGSDQPIRLANRMGGLSQFPIMPLTELMHITSRYVHAGDTVVVLTSYWNEEGARALGEWNRMHRNLIVYRVIGDEELLPLPGISVMTERLPYKENRDKEAVS
ncbi:DUF58 domain-containing protein [Gorillibacterium massiliense]|uniref:DUF58 domain-containing protein n=1 Tax=Gorillibacterium massiliense TaxID=1280390 RepID=UPI0004AFF48C|nr:DUF58 domain-containing protein [Gorillibacterium massiliense]